MPVDPSAVPSTGLSADVFAQWKRLNSADGLIPYLDYTTPTFYDDISGGVQRLMAAKDTPTAVREEHAVGLRQVERVSLTLRRRQSEERPPGEPRSIGYLYLAPAFLVFAGFVLVPLVHAAWLSLFQWDGLTPGTWVGLHNYGDVVSDPALRRAFGHALVLIVFYAVLPVGIGLVLAGLVARIHVPGLPIFRTILFLPQVVALVVVAVMRQWSALLPLLVQFVYCSDCRAPLRWRFATVSPSRCRR